MNADESKSASPAVATSRDAHDPGENLSEDAFLAREAEMAQAAMLQTLDRLKADLATAGDVRLWTRLHPWAAVGTAATAGLVAAAAINSVRKPNQRVVEFHVDRPLKAEMPAAASGLLAGSLGWLWGPLFDLAKTAATTMIVSTVRAASQGPSASDGAQPTDGQAARDPSAASI